MLRSIAPSSIGASGAVLSSAVRQLQRHAAPNSRTGRYQLGAKGRADDCQGSRTGPMPTSAAYSGPPAANRSSFVSGIV